MIKNRLYSIMMVAWVVCAQATIVFAAPSKKSQEAAYRAFAEQVYEIRDSLEEVLAIDPSMLDLQPMEHMLAQEPMAAKQAVWHMMLSQAYSRLSNADINRRDTDKRQQLDSLSMQHRNLVLTDIEALMQVKAEWLDTLMEPLSDDSLRQARKYDEQYFDGDLLHVLAIAVDDYDKAAAAYAKHGKTEASILMRMWGPSTYGDQDALRQLLDEALPTSVGAQVAYAYCSLCFQWTTEERYAFLTDIIKRVKPSPAIVSLQSMIDQIESPRVEMPEVAFYPGRPEEVRLIMKNVPEVHMCIRSADGKKTYAFDQTIRAPHWGQRSPIETDTATISLTLPAGKYDIELTHSKESTHKTYRVTSVGLIQVHHNNDLRIIPVDWVSGRAVPATLSYQNKSWNKKVRAQRTSTDMTDWEWMLNTYKADAPRTHRDLQIWTNRDLFRPGQTVRFVLQAWLTDPEKDQLKVLSKERISVILQRSYNQKVDTVQVTTDEWGNATGEFIIPQDAELGTYTLQATGNKLSGSHAIQVTEYKRPTFEVKMEPYRDTFGEGDTIILSGKALHLSGSPVQGAIVEYTLSLQPRWRWGYARSGYSKEIAHGTTTTDDEGMIRVPCYIDSALLQNEEIGFEVARLQVQVTSQNGETHEGELFAAMRSNKPYHLQVVGLNDSAIVVYALNGMAQKQSGIEGTLHLQRQDGWIDTMPFSVGQPIVLRSPLVAGTYHITAMNAIDTSGVYHCNYFDIKHIEGKTFFENDFIHVPTQNLTPTGIDLYVAPKEEDCLLWLFISNQNGIIDSMQVVVAEGLKHIHIPYKKEMGKSASVLIAYMRNGHTWNDCRSFELAQPKLDLTLGWKTFRDKTMPGADETWTLRVTQDGKPCKARVMATMYDAALDRITQGQPDWTFTHSFERPFTWINHRLIGHSSIHINNGIYPVRQYYSPNYYRWENFGSWKTVTFSGSPVKVRGMASVSKADATKALKYGGQPGSNSSVETLGVADDAHIENEVEIRDAAVEQEEEVFVVVENMPSFGGVEETKKEEFLRTELQEDALWMPALITDRKGEVTMQFRMPQSLTEWRLMLMAHSMDLHHASMDTTIRVQRALMVQPMWPRFMRIGDEVQLAATVQNRQEEKFVGEAYWEVRSADSTRLLYSEQVRAKIDPLQSWSAYCTIHPEATWGDSVRISLIVNNRSVGDGEAVFVAVQPKEPFMKPEPTTTRQTKSPVELIREALDEMKMPSLYNALDCALAIYLGKEKGRPTTLAETKLRLLQQSDGGWAWCPGMESSYYMTMSVIEILIRMPSVMSSEVRKGMAYLDREELKDYQSRIEKKISLFPSESTCHYLYLSHYIDNRVSADVSAMRQVYMNELHKKADLLSNRKEARHTPFTIYGVAKLSEVFEQANATTTATTCREHLKHYSVFREGFGRYYATEQAQYSWMDYKLPTQLAAIQALRNTDEQYTAEMMLWVLRQKQTQQWQNPLNVVEVSQLVKTMQDTPIGEAWELMLEASKDTYAQGALRIETAIVDADHQSIARSLHVGEQVGVKIRLTADRDMDFIKITIPLAGCMEPKEQLSGYRWLGTAWGFVAVYDDRAEIYLHHFRTGTATLEIPYYIVRAGAYAMPAASVVSTYNPDFNSNDVEKRIKVDRN